MLIAKNAKIDAGDPYGSTPLHLAASNGDDLVLEIMLQNSANENNIEPKDDSGRTPLHVAAFFTTAHAKTLEILIQNGAKIDVKDDQGQTPMHLAALKMRSSRVGMLVKYGASLKIRDKYGFTPLEYALQGNAAIMEHKLQCIKALCYNEK